MIGVPDISVANIMPGKFGRFVLGSDGVWDVMSTSDARKLAYEYSRPEDIAMLLAFESQTRRLTRRMRMDDISVIVVDINHDMLPVNSTFADCSDCCRLS